MNVKFSVKFWRQWRKLFQGLNIRQKIVCGYGLSLGIALVGTTGGLVIGHGYFQAARENMVIANQEAALLGSLQGVLLEIKVHQQKLIFHVTQQKNLAGTHSSEFKEHLQKIKNLLFLIKEFNRINPQHDLQVLINKNEIHLIEYLEKLQDLHEQISQLDLQSESSIKAQQLITDFYQNQSIDNFFKFSRNLTDIFTAVSIRNQEAQRLQDQASILEALIIFISILFSIFIATLLALYTSKIITLPLNQVTNIAERVTKESNFELQAPVTTKDEIGTLANRLNQLIQQVKSLLEIQKSESQTQLIQYEKMSNLGRMLAGVAHEINNPINFISGNILHAQNYVDDLLTLVKTYEEEIPNTPEEVQVLAEEIDLEFLETDLPKTLQSIKMGTERTREIIQSLKNFSRLDQGEIKFVDLHPCIDNTLLILNNRLKNSINVIRKYGEIPSVCGYMALFYQVFMNLLSNAIDALEEKSQTYNQFSPEITIITESLDQDWVVVKIVDNGAGISPENQNKIFENFFTTKPRGIGTGLGLAITHQIVVDKHRGKIGFHSELNQGTEFIIYLPTNMCEL